MRLVRSSLRVAIVAPVLAFLGCGGEEPKMENTTPVGESPTEIAVKRAAENKAKGGGPSRPSASPPGLR